MIAAGLQLLRNSLRRMTRTPKSRALILLYHRVTELSLDPFCLAVTPAHFREHVGVLADHYNVIPLEQVLSCLHDGDLPPRAIVLTFDDGYYDILHHAQPILAERAMPATVFVTTSYVESQQEPWWDELEHLCFSSRPLPGSLNMRFPGQDYFWQDAEPAGRTTELPSTKSICNWNTYQSVDFTSRQVLFRTLHSHLKPLLPKQREEVIDALFEGRGLLVTTNARFIVFSLVMRSFNWTPMGSYRLVPTLFIIPSSQDYQPRSSSTRLRGRTLPGGDGRPRDPDICIPFRDTR